MFPLQIYAEIIKEIEKIEDDRISDGERRRRRPVVVVVVVVIVVLDCGPVVEKGAYK